MYTLLKKNQKKKIKHLLDYFTSTIFLKSYLFRQQTHKFKMAGPKNQLSSLWSIQKQNEKLTKKKKERYTLYNGKRCFFYLLPGLLSPFRSGDLETDLSLLRLRLRSLDFDFLSFTGVLDLDLDRERDLEADLE